MVGPEGPTVERGYLELSEIEFLRMSNGEFLFMGWTINSELQNTSAFRMWGILDDRYSIIILSLPPPGRVRGLMNKPLKKERIEACTEECAEMVTQMLRPVRTLSETLVCGRR